MRAAVNRRYGLWAAVFAIAPRKPELTETELKAEAIEAIRELIQEGCLYVFQVPGMWGSERVLDVDEAEAAFAEPNNWKPKRMNLRRLARLGATDKGADLFSSGALGAPSRLRMPVSHAYLDLELEPFTLREAAAIFFALLGMAAGGMIGGLSGAAVAAVVNGQAGGPSFLFPFGIVAGCLVGAGFAIAVFKRHFPQTFHEGVAEPNIIPDQYMEGPSLNPFDEAGNPRY